MRRMRIWSALFSMSWQAMWQLSLNYSKTRTNSTICGSVFTTPTRGSFPQRSRFHQWSLMIPEWELEEEKRETECKTERKSSHSMRKMVTRVSLGTYRTLWLKQASVQYGRWASQTAPTTQTVMKSNQRNTFYVTAPSLHCGLIQITRKTSPSAQHHLK